MLPIWIGVVRTMPSEEDQDIILRPRLILPPGQDVLNGICCRIPINEARDCEPEVVL